MAFDGGIYNRRNGVMSREQGRFFRGQGGSFRDGRFGGPPRRGPLNLNARSSAYGISKPSYRAKPLPWNRNLLDGSLKAAGFSGSENGTKLYISNLDVKVSDDDIKELFSEFGLLKRHAVHYDQNGLPNGSAEVIFARKSDAVKALKKYNDVLLDGKPMKIEIIGSSSEVSVSPRFNVTRTINGRRAVMMGRGRSEGFFAVNRSSRGSFAVNRGRCSFLANRGRGSFGVNRGFGQTTQWVVRKPRGQTRGRGGRGGGVWRKNVVDKSADELDKELESYHAEAMQT